MPGATAPRYVLQQLFSAMPSLKITASAMARRAARGACCAITRCARLRASSPGAAARAAICVLGAAVDDQHAVDARAPARAIRPAAARRRRTAAGGGSGLRAAPRRRSAGAGCLRGAVCASASAKASARMRSRSSAPSAAMIAAPKASRSAGIAAPPARSGRARWRRCRPVPRRSPTSIAATVLLPLPMPPVRPMAARGSCRLRRGHVVRQAQPSQSSTVGAPASITDQAAAGQEGPERHVAAFAQRCRRASCRCRHGADAPRRSARSAAIACQPSQAPERGQQLEVAVAHAFLAGGELEQPVDRPQRQVARDGAPQRIEPAARVQPSAAATSPAHSSGRVRASGSTRGVPVDQRQRDQRWRRTRTRAARTGCGAEAPADGAEQQRGEQLDQRVARARCACRRRSSAPFSTQPAQHAACSRASAARGRRPGSASAGGRSPAPAGRRRLRPGRWPVR